MSLTVVAEKLPVVLTDFATISLVYLFGSQVNGQVGAMSDYDLAILTDSIEDNVTIQVRFQHAIVQAIGTNKVDVVLLNHAPIDLAYHIISEGKLLYKRDLLTQVEFEAQVLSQYGDYLPVLRSHYAQILQGDVNAKRVQRYREALGRTQRSLSQARTS
jgi:predicted nucleotidyltransferase